MLINPIFLDEIKYVMLTCQNIPNRTSPRKIIVARPQGCDEAYDECTLEIVNVINDEDDYELINNSSDDLSSEVHLIKKQTI